MPVSPPIQGYAPPAITPTLSPAAPLVRLTAVTASLSAYELPTGPRDIFDQQGVQCCVSCALAGVMEMLFPEWPTLSPIFHYHVTRYDNGGGNPDGTLALNSGLATLGRQGICLAALHLAPFTSLGAEEVPAMAAYADAATRVLARRGVLSRYRRIGGPSLVANIRDILRQNWPVVLGIQLPTGYPNGFPNGDMVWRDPDSPPRSGTFHCVLVTGYDDARQAVHVYDSHGAEIFEKGRWWMGYRVVDSTIVTDAYSFA